MFADVGKKNPAEGIVGVGELGTGRLRLLEKQNVTPGGVTEMFRVVVGEAGPHHAVCGNLVPFLAGDFAGFAADTDGGVGEKSCVGHADAF
jgi:hypothetical protein